MVTQPASAARDQRGNVVPMVPGDFGDLRTVVLTVPSGQKKRLSDAAGYPARPTVVGWLLQNPNSSPARVSGADVTATHGGFLPKASGGAPGTMQLMTDPGKTYVAHADSDPLSFELLLLGKNLEAPP